MSGAMLRDRTAIVGIGQTRFGKGFAESEEELACQAIKMALDDAGIDPSEVDAISSYSLQTSEEEEIARDLGFNDLTFFSRTPAGGGGGCATVGHVAMAVALGQAKVAVAYRSRKRSGKASRMWAGTADRVASPRQMWTSPFGHVRPSDDVAFLARRYMHDYGATREHFANIALAFRKHANRNPHAVMRDRPMTREEYMNARWISEPLCLFDCCLETDGALAVVVVSAERAKDCKGKPAYIHSFGQGISKGSSMMFGYRAPDPYYTQAHACAKVLWEGSDFKPGDVDVAQIYDAFSPEIIFSLEGFGFCKRGEGAAFTEGGRIEHGGALPLNTGGGGLSEAYVHGYNHILEGVKQIRGISTAQVPEVKCAFVSSSDGVPTGALLLRP
ncbi:MAG TPA: lipid-transfer protein [Burkholderiales bacterium]|nr:lipid-transfer protein [Burkholderiales bacterium]